MGIRKGLTSILLTGSLLAGCYSSDDASYNDSYDSRQDYSAEATESSQENIQCPLNAPLTIFFRDSDERFRNLSSAHFFACNYSSDKMDFGDIRQTYRRGEKFVVAGVFPKELYGSRMTVVSTGPNGEYFGGTSKMVNQNEETFLPVFNTSPLLDKLGPGLYKFGWAFDGKLACLIYIRLEE